LDRKTLILSALAWIAAVGAARAPGLEFGQAIAVPCASIAWTARAGFRGWAIFLTSSLVFLSIAAPSRFADFATGAVAGWVLGESQRQGRSPEKAVVWAVLPFAVWTAALAFSGVHPLTEQIRATIDRMIVEAGRRGDFSPEGLAQLRTSSEHALGFAQRTWVGVRIAELWVALLIARAIAMRGAPPFGRLNVSDGVTWTFAAALASYLAGQMWGQSGVSTIALNAIVFCAVIYFLRGTAIEWHWMDRAGVRRFMRIGLLAGGFLLFLPFHAILTASLGLFDTWFDFRKLKTEAEREDPFRVFHQSSGDDT
jgi:hypothetical protein